MRIRVQIDDDSVSAGVKAKPYAANLVSWPLWYVESPPAFNARKTYPMRFYILFFLLFLVSLLAAAPAPILTSIPYFGDQASSPIQAVAVDPAGNIYITGTTTGGIPIVNAFQPKPGGGNCAPDPGDGAFYVCPNIFVAKFDPTGTKLIYSTYLSGDPSDFAAGLAVDASGNAYIAGTAQPASLQPQSGGNAFVKKLSPDGSTLLYTRYIGGNTIVKGIAVDSNGNASIAATASDRIFPACIPCPRRSASVKSLFVTNDGGKHVAGGISTTGCPLRTSTRSRSIPVLRLLFMPRLQLDSTSPPMRDQTGPKCFRPSPWPIPLWSIQSIRPRCMSHILGDLRTILQRASMAARRGPPSAITFLLRVTLTRSRLLVRSQLTLAIRMSCGRLLFLSCRRL